MEAALPTASTYLFGAVCPERDEGVALVLPEVSTAAIDVFLAELSRTVPARTHAVLVLDSAAWNVLRAKPGRPCSLANFPWLPTSVTTS